MEQYEHITVEDELGQLHCIMRVKLYQNPYRGDKGTSCCSVDQK